MKAIKLFHDKQWQTVDVGPWVTSIGDISAALDIPSGDIQCLPLGNGAAYYSRSAQKDDTVLFNQPLAFAVRHILGTQLQIRGSAIVVDQNEFSS